MDWSTKPTGQKWRDHKEAESAWEKAQENSPGTAWQGFLPWRDLLNFTERHAAKPEWKGDRREWRLEGSRLRLQRRHLCSTAGGRVKREKTWTVHCNGTSWQSIAVHY